MASFGGIADYVSLKELLAALPPAQRKERERILGKTAELQKKLKSFEGHASNSKPSLQDLALAIFNMKEFIYLK